MLRFACYVSTRRSLPSAKSDITVANITIDSPVCETDYNKAAGTPYRRHWMAFLVHRWLTSCWTRIFPKLLCCCFFAPRLTSYTQWNRSSMLCTYRSGRNKFTEAQGKLLRVYQADLDDVNRLRRRSFKMEDHFPELRILLVLARYVFIAICVGTIHVIIYRRNLH